MSAQAMYDGYTSLLDPRWAAMGFLTLMGMLFLLAASRTRNRFWDLLWKVLALASLGAMASIAINNIKPLKFIVRGLEDALIPDDLSDKSLAIAFAFWLVVAILLGFFYIRTDDVGSEKKQRWILAGFLVWIGSGAFMITQVDVVTEAIVSFFGEVYERLVTFLNSQLTPP